MIMHAHGWGVDSPSPASVMVKGRSKALTASPRDVASPKGIPNLQQRHGSFASKTLSNLAGACTLLSHCCPAMSRSLGS